MKRCEYCEREGVQTDYYKGKQACDSCMEILVNCKEFRKRKRSIIKAMVILVLEGGLKMPEDKKKSKLELNPKEYL